MFTEELFTVGRICKQPRCPSIGEWIKKMWCIYIYIYAMEYYSAIRVDKIQPFVVPWMDLEIIILTDMISVNI